MNCKNIFLTALLLTSFSMQIGCMHPEELTTVGQRLEEKISALQVLYHIGDNLMPEISRAPNTMWLMNKKIDILENKATSPQFDYRKHGQKVYFIKPMPGLKSFEERAHDLYVYYCSRAHNPL